MHPAVVPKPAPCCQYNCTLTPIRPEQYAQPHAQVSSSLALSSASLPMLIYTSKTNSSPVFLPFSWPFSPSRAANRGVRWEMPQNPPEYPGCKSLALVPCNQNALRGDEHDERGGE